MSFFRRKAPTPAQKEAQKFDRRAAALIVTMNECRANLFDPEQQDKRSLNRRCYELADQILRIANDSLTGAANEYREGRLTYPTFDVVDLRLQMVNGLIGRAEKTQYEAMGNRLRCLEARLEHLRSREEVEAEAAPSEAAVMLAGELFDSGLACIVECFRDWTQGYPSLAPRGFERAVTALDRADEALGPDSAGVTLVGRLDALKVRLRSVKTA